MEAVRGSAKGQYFCKTKPGVNILRKMENWTPKGKLFHPFSYLLSENLSYIFPNLANKTLKKCRSAETYLTSGGKNYF